MLTSEDGTRSGGFRPGPARLALAGLIGRLGVPVLLLAAAVFGASLAAAVFVGVWRHADSGRRSAESALTSARREAALLKVQNARLASEKASIVESRAATAREKAALADALAVSHSRLSTSSRQAAAERASLLQRNRELQAGADRLARQSRGLAGDAAELASLATKLRSDVSSLSAYLSQTSASSLDPAFLQTQLAYLRPLVEEIRARAASLSGQAEKVGGPGR